MIDGAGKLKAKAGPKHDRIGRWLDSRERERDEDEARSAANKPEMGIWPISGRHGGGEGEWQLCMHMLSQGSCDGA